MTYAYADEDGNALTPASALADGEFTEGDTLVLPDAPEIEGYTYSKAVIGETEVTSETTVTADVTVTLVYTKIVTEVTVVYNANNAAEGEEAATYTDPGTPVALTNGEATYTALLTTVPTIRNWKDGNGKTAIGWTLDPTAETVELIEGGDTITLDDSAATVTLYAVYPTGEVTLTYELNTPEDLDGTATASTAACAATATPGKAFTVAAAPALTDENGKAVTNTTYYEFLGWSSDPDATAKTYTAGATDAKLEETDTANSTLTLYGVWQLKQITITFYLDKMPTTGVTGLTAPGTYDVARANFDKVDLAAKGTLSAADNETLSKAGYALVGWKSYNKDADGNEIVYDLDTVALNDADRTCTELILVPVWQATTLDITWDISNIPSGTAFCDNAVIESKTEKEKSTTNLATLNGSNPITSSSTYWQVIGWSTEADYDITAALKDGYKASEDNRSFYADAATIDLTSADIAKAENGALTLYAVWSVTKINLTWNANWTGTETTKVTGAPASVSAAPNETGLTIETNPTFPAAPTASDGTALKGTFLGWSASSSATKADYASGEQALKDTDILAAVQTGIDTKTPALTLYGVWASADQTVTYAVTTGVEGATIASATYDYNGAEGVTATNVTDTTVTVPYTAQNVEITMATLTNGWKYPSTPADNATLTAGNGTSFTWTKSTDPDTESGTLKITTPAIESVTIDFADVGLFTTKEVAIRKSGTAGGSYDAYYLTLKEAAQEAATGDTIEILSTAEGAANTNISGIVPIGNDVTLKVSKAVTVSSGGTLTVNGNLETTGSGTITVASGGTLTVGGNVTAGAKITVSGDMAVTGTCTLSGDGGVEVAAGGALTVAETGTLNVTANEKLEIKADGIVIVKNGGSLKTGESVTIKGNAVTDTSNQTAPSKIYYVTKPAAGSGITATATKDNAGWFGVDLLDNSTYAYEYSYGKDITGLPAGAETDPAALESNYIDGNIKVYDEGLKRSKTASNGTPIEYQVARVVGTVSTEKTYKLDSTKTVNWPYAGDPYAEGNGFPWSLITSNNCTKYAFISFQGTAAGIIIAVGDRGAATEAQAKDTWAVFKFAEGEYWGVDLTDFALAATASDTPSGITTSATTTDEAE